MTDTLQHQFLWLDLETTGLLDASPGGLFSGTGAILEFALLLASDNPSEPKVSFGNELATYESAIRYDLAKVQMSDFVKSMHTKSGLLASCESSTLSLDDADAFLFDLCQALTGRQKPRGLKLAGNSVHFDRMWIRALMPKFDSCLTYQVFDLSGTLADFCRKYRRDDADLNAWLDREEEPKHRAIDDVRWSLETFRRMHGVLASGS